MQKRHTELHNGNGSSECSPKGGDLVGPGPRSFVMQSPFLVLGLPRSRTAWLSRFLNYGEWTCGHDEARRFRSLDDARAWASQPCVGSIETAVAGHWRMIDKIAPGTRVAIIRRPVDEVLQSLSNLFGPSFNQNAFRPRMNQLDAKLRQVAARLKCPVFAYSDLADEAACASLFQYCLPYVHDTAHWHAWSGVNVQCDMRAMVKYADAYFPQLSKFSDVCKQITLSDMLRASPDMEAFSFEEVSVSEWRSAAQQLFREHCALVNERPEEWANKNWPLMEKLGDIGAMQIMSAKCNGRMFGYLMTIISPSLTGENKVSASNLTFFADESAPGLGIKLQRAAINALRNKGVREIFWEAGDRGSGPRLGSLYRRLGAVEHGRTYRLAMGAC